MKIGIYTATALPKIGGQELVVDSLARHFVELGHQVVVLAPHPRRPLRANDSSFSYPVLRHPRFYSTRHFVSWYRVFLRGLVRRWQCDVLHCHGLYPSAYLAALEKDRLGIPVIVTAHGGDVYEKNARLRKPVLYPRHEAAVKFADRLVSISRFTREGYLRFGANESRIVDIPNGIDIAPIADPVGDDVPPLEPKLTGGYFFFIGRLVPRKGVDVLIRALARLPDAGMPPLVIAGDGPERPRLEALADELKLAGRVVFVGSVHGSRKAQLFQNALCTVVPSRWWEAFGLIVLESFAASKPVIVTRHPGLADLVEEGTTGHIVAPESIEELAAAMRRIATNGQAASVMGLAGRKIVEDFTWRAVAQRHLDLYASLTSARAACSRAAVHPIGLSA